MSIGVQNFLRADWHLDHPNVDVLRQEMGREAVTLVFARNEEELASRRGAAWARIRS